MPDFGTQLRAAAGRLEDKLVLAVVTATVQTASAMKAVTPHKTGRAQQNWHVGINTGRVPYNSLAASPPNSFIDPSPLVGYKPGDVVAIYNSAPYAELLAEGYSDAAAPGVIFQDQVVRFGERLKENFYL